ncbi:hypothetical protein [Amaricoccus sp. W119]|uniref:hypothetical protein n=1 Tax=Amaricoccus sp. W119 TaxID=3391833 RepID=UPI0039A6464A
MADITQMQIRGDWRVIVRQNNAGFAQRVRALGTADGDRALAGTPGMIADIHGDGQVPWVLKIEHNDGSGWQDNWIRDMAPGLTTPLPPGVIIRRIESEDITTPDSDRDFDDLRIELQKIGMVAQPARPHAIHPSTLTMMPDGIFEASLGRHFMAVTVRNIWTRDWPVGASVGLTQRSRAWLAAGGVRVVDQWSAEDQRIFDQEVTADGRVVVGALPAWDTIVVHFKVDVAEAAPRKHQVEVEVAEPISHINREARSPMMVTRTTFDSQTSTFVSECDVGRLTAAIGELVVDYNTLKRAVFRARRLFRGDGGSTGGSPGHGGDGGPGGCDPAEIERIRQQLLAFLKGERIDLCQVVRELQCCCAHGGGDGDGGSGDDGTWGGSGGTGMEVLMFPSLVDYRVDYAPDFNGQFGPLPFEDPWWKLLLVIIAIILSLATAASAAADLANGSDDVVIGNVRRSLLNERVDAAVAELNGNRSLTAAMFSYLDARTGEDNTVPRNALGSVIDTAGAIMTNDEILEAIDAFNENPDDEAAKAGVRVFKSGARTGLTFGRMLIVRNSTRDDDRDGVADREFIDQLVIGEDPDFPNGVSDSGDSGSLWLHWETFRVVGLNHAGSRPDNTAFANRIEDVMAAMDIRFA